jgi:hypothetical protein
VDPVFTEVAVVVGVDETVPAVDTDVVALLE